MNRNREFLNAILEKCNVRLCVSMERVSAGKWNGRGERGRWRTRAAGCSGFALWGLRVQDLLQLFRPGSPQAQDLGVFAHVLRGVLEHAAPPGGPAMAHRMPAVSPQDSRPRIPYTEPPQQHKSDRGFPPLYRVGSPAPGQLAPAPTASSSGSRSPARRGTRRSGCWSPWHPGWRICHRRVTRCRRDIRIRPPRQLPELQTSGADHWLRLRHLRIPLHACAPLHGPDICA